jgi:hypothetical protein
MKKLFIVGVFSLATLSVFAQDTIKKNATTMKIVVEDNGKQEVIEKVFTDDALAQKEIKKFSDSLDLSMKESNGKRKIITVNVNKNTNEFTTEDGGKRNKRVIIRRNDGEKGPESEDIMILRNDGRKGATIKRFGRPGEDRMKNNLSEDDEIHVQVEGSTILGKSDLPPGTFMHLGEKRMKFIDKSLKEQRQSKTIKGLLAHPNNPFNGKINVRFNAIQKGDVMISVTDVNGKEIASESVKNFEGKYLGQIDLKKATSGIYFVRAVQNGDGMVIRVEVK